MSITESICSFCFEKAYWDVFRIHDELIIPAMRRDKINVSVVIIQRVLTELFVS
jgi:hypothetical protein